MRRALIQFSIAISCIFISASFLLAQAPNFEPAKTVKISAADRNRFESVLKELDKEFNQLHTPEWARSGKVYTSWTDKEIGRKAIRWILQHDEFYTPKFVAMTDKAIELTKKRLKSLPEFTAGAGTVLGYLSVVDASVQPYAVYLPPDANKKKPDSLLVVLHGRNQTLNEISFIDAHEGKPYPKGELENGMQRVVLHVYGRTNNAYRWAGEIDVNEAILQTVNRLKDEMEININLNKIDLQGFSMGGAGAWHLGLHNPSWWRSVEAGAGFNETVNYARLKNISPWVEKTLRIYDAYAWARNVTAVPTIGYGGEEDPQLASSENVLNQLKKERFALKKEGLLTTASDVPFLRVVGAKMGHRVDPASRKIMDEFVSRQVKTDQLPRKIDAVTYSLKYSQLGWIRIVKMSEQFQKAWVQAELSDDGKTATISRLDNVEAFFLHARDVKKVKIGEQLLDKPPYLMNQFVREGDKWRALGLEELTEDMAKPFKRPGVQGPIDDAFTSSFVVLGPEKSQTGVEQRRLDEFSANWSKFMRGDLPMGNVKDFQEEKAIGSPKLNLILFGTPANNPVIARILPKLGQIKWTDTEFTLGGKTYSTKDYLPVLIAPNPFNSRRYVVINSGHTFGRKDFEGTNALLYPRLGDWAVVKKRPDGSTETVTSGFFNENWKFAGE
ncbi:MAG: hypothetical protein ACKO0V_03515 [bacterium]